MYTIETTDRYPKREKRFQEKRLIVTDTKFNLAKRQERARKTLQEKNMRFLSDIMISQRRNVITTENC